MSDQTQETEDAGEKSAPRSVTINPVLRHTLQEKFVDGKWWTVAGMADALGSAIPNDLAARFYASKYPNHKLPVSQLVRSARRACVQSAVGGMGKNLIEAKTENGQRFYRLKAPTRVNYRGARRPPLQTTPGDTVYGVTSPGAIAALLQLGSPASAEDLVKLLLPAMKPYEDLLAWYQARFVGEANTTPTIEFLHLAVVNDIVGRLKDGRNVKIVRTFFVTHDLVEAYAANAANAANAT